MCFVDRGTIYYQNKISDYNHCSVISVCSNFRRQAWRWWSKVGIQMEKWTRGRNTRTLYEPADVGLDKWGIFCWRRLRSEVEQQRHTILHIEKNRLWSIHL